MDETKSKIIYVLIENWGQYVEYVKGQKDLGSIDTFEYIVDHTFLRGRMEGEVRKIGHGYINRYDIAGIEDSIMIAAAEWKLDSSYITPEDDELGEDF